MISASDALRTARALHTTWGTKGIARRGVYEAQRRLGLTRRSEERWLAAIAPTDPRFRDVDLVTMPKLPPKAAQPIRLYGALEIEPMFPDSWHAHPFTGHRRPLDHWSQLSEGDPVTGDIKDLWELGRLTWLGPLLQRVAGGDDLAADEVWQHIESFIEHNPPFRGPQWMCGQESALRGIIVMFGAYALRDHASTTPERLAGAARLVATTVGRVRPTLGYALSQRNNHAISEAAFLWTATQLVDDLPNASQIERRARRALEEAVADQFYDDGSYAQHSPTYQRLALHALLWVAAVADAAATTRPAGIDRAARQSFSFLTDMLDARSGRMPNLGGNDGALLFALTETDIGDFRPFLDHLAARSAIPAPEPAPWESEARWFGLEPSRRSSSDAIRSGIAHHVHRGDRSHLVLRAGPLRHRPAHADQLHVDLWIDGINVAGDAGSFRYTAPGPWQNALADEGAHNVPRLPSRAQATRRGRFLWSRWETAQLMERAHSETGDLTVAMISIEGAELRRTVARRNDTHLVVDETTDPGALVRWNLPQDTELSCLDGVTHATGEGWQAVFAHSGRARVRQRSCTDPGSGWRSPTYGTREPIAALELRVTESGCAVSMFAPSSELLDETEALRWLSDRNVRAWIGC